MYDGEVSPIPAEVSYFPATFGSYWPKLDRMQIRLKANVSPPAIVHVKDGELKAAHYSELMNKKVSCISSVGRASRKQSFKLFYR